MPSPRTGALVHFATHLAPPPDATDADLLGRFVRSRDEAAFAAVVRRHGRTVLGVCRRVLGNAADADDAFQATFLTLAKKAHRVAFRDDVSAWLFAVAVRAGREVLRRRSRRACREAVGRVPDVAARPDAGDADAGRAVLDEVAKLSPAYRAAVVLCELDGVGRAAAAKRLGIPEGTLSSRLAAARRQLAVRLRARGVTPAVLAPLGVGVPAALAASASPSVVPSASVSTLVEVLVRTSLTRSAGHVVAAFLVLAVAVVGGGFGDDPKPPAKPAAAAVGEKPAEAGRLALTFREQVRFLTPAGRDLPPVDYVAAKRVLPDMVSGMVSIGGADGFKIERFLPTAGRVGPGGVTPLGAKGLRLLTPGTPAAVKVVGSEGTYDRVAGWRADGRQSLAVTAKAEGQVFGVTKYDAFWVDAETGRADRLPFAREHQVMDASADGQFYLTRWEQPPGLALLGVADPCHVCRVSRDGTITHDLKPLRYPTIHTEVVSGTPRHTKFHAIGEEPARYALSPDGGRLAVVGTQVPDRSAASLGTVGGPSRVFVLTFRENGATALTALPLDPPGPAQEVECRCAAWSPDGKQLVSCWRPMSWKDRQTWHVVACDADGRNSRTVATFETKADEQIRSVDWR